VEDDLEEQLLRATARRRTALRWAAIVGAACAIGLVVGLVMRARSGPGQEGDKTAAPATSARAERAPAPSVERADPPEAAPPAEPSATAARQAAAEPEASAEPAATSARVGTATAEATPKSRLAARPPSTARARATSATAPATKPPPATRPPRTSPGTSKGIVRDAPF